MKKNIKVLLMIMFSFALFIGGCTTPPEDKIEPVYNMAIYTVHHYYEDVNGYYTSTESDSEEFSARIGTTVTAEQKNKDYYTFKSSSSSTTGLVNENGDLNLYLYYQRNAYIISLVDTYQNYSAQLSGTWGAGITLPTRVDQTKTFVGWAYDVQGTLLASLTEMPTENLTLYAVWQ